MRKKVEIKGEAVYQLDKEKSFKEALEILKKIPCKELIGENNKPLLDKMRKYVIVSGDVLKRLQKELPNYWKKNTIIRNAIKDIVKNQLERNESQIEDKQIIFDFLNENVNNYIPDDDYFSLYQYEYDNYDIYSGVIPPATVAERDKQLAIEEGFDERVLLIANETYRPRKNALGHLD